MKRVVKIFLTLLSLTTIMVGGRGLSAQNCAESSLSTDSLRSSLTYLSSEQLMGRYPATEGDSLAAFYIADKFRNYGLKPFIGDSFLIPFTFLGEGGEERVSFNVAAFIEGEVDDYIMVGAHYDHLGMGGRSSRYRGEAAIHPGADDNGSGVSSLLEIARVLNGKEREGRGLALVAFGAEEIGLVGSSRLADSLDKMDNLPKFMVNIDMVGRLRKQELFIGGVGTFAEADSLIDLLNRESNFSITKKESGSETSDHATFNRYSVPVLHFTTGVHTEYHTPADSVGLINFEGLEEVTSFVLEALGELSNPQLVSQHIQLDDGGHRQEKNRATVSLGLIPDFTYNGEDGFRAGPVTEGRPGANAGLKEGDIIYEMGGSPIKNVYDYMGVMANYSEGESVEIKVKRGEETLLLTVHF